MESEIRERAQDIIKSRRFKAYTENEERIREVNEKIPQIRAINDAIHETGKELIKIIAGGRSADTQSKIDMLRKNNLDAQALTRRLLVSNGFPEDHLDIHYTCPKCNDTGFCGDKYCDCFRELYGRLAAEEMNKKSKLNLSCFDTFSLKYYKGEELSTMRHILDLTREYAEKFTPGCMSIFMTGRTGLGKTHLSLAIANVVLSKGYGVIYDSAINILREIEREHFSREHSSETIDLVMDADLLILDDLGTEYESAFYNATVYNIINTRLNSGKTTIISTNLDFKGISRRYDERVVSRIVSAYKCLEFAGEDVRLQIRANKYSECQK